MKKNLVKSMLVEHRNVGSFEIKLDKNLFDHLTKNHMNISVHSNSSPTGGYSARIHFSNDCNDYEYLNRYAYRFYTNEEWDISKNVLTKDGNRFNLTSDNLYQKD